MRVHNVLVAFAAVALAAGCSANPAEESPETSGAGAPTTPATEASPTSPVAEASPTIESDLGETIDLTWTVRHDGREIGVVGVGHSSGKRAGIDAAFEPTISLASAAKSVGVTHFNWYQYLVKDTDPPKDAAGERLVAPFVDPPCGGYGGRDRDWADHFPWYWDEIKAPSEDSSHADRGNQLNANIEDETLFLSDAPDGAPGTELSFRTYLTGVSEHGSDTVFLGGWSWSVGIGGRQVTVGEVERLGEDEPASAEFEEILAGSSCPG